MSKQYSTDHFVKKRVEVEEPDRAMTFSREAGSARKRARAFDPAAENIYLLGLPGSGRKTLAHSLAEEFGLEVVDREAPDAPALEELAGRPGHVVVCRPRDIADPADRERMTAGGRVFCLLVDVPTALERLAPSPDQADALRRELVEKMNEFEPLFMTCARHPLRGHDSPGRVLRAALDALRF
jgi:DNA replication protein DnaC